MSPQRPKETDAVTPLERYTLAPGLEISRIVTGLWQVADMERDGRYLDQDAAASHLADYTTDGFDTFDMADHYGSAELIAGRFVQNHTPTRAALLTKWCPEPGTMTADAVRAGVQRSLDRLQVKQIDLLQFHWWMFEHPGYIDAMKELAALREEGLIRHLGVTNFDTDHLRVLVKHGIPLVSNQVCFSVLDRRPAGNMTDFCLENRIGHLAYGTLGGGFLSDKWVDVSEPGAGEIEDWSKMKYQRFIEALGGWDILQLILSALATIARKHDVSVANVATRWVLEQPAVAAVIVGARLGETEHREDNSRVFSFSLDDEDHHAIEEALAKAKPIPGDSGDEYRRPPFLTASGDLSHHLDHVPPVYRTIADPQQPSRRRIDSGSMWESIGGYSRATRIGNRILVSGTTATHGAGELICPGDPVGQTVFILDKIAASISSLGGTLADVVRTRIYLRDITHCEAVAAVHGRYFGHVRPANSLVEVSALVGTYDVEIEAEAELSI